jgi:hypothetical protein
VQTDHGVGLLRLVLTPTDLRLRGADVRCRYGEDSPRIFWRAIMTTPIVRMYETEKQARDAVRKLRGEGFRRNTILLVTPSPKGEAESIESFSSSDMASELPPGHAEVHAGGVRQGRSLVAIRAPFGQGGLAKEILCSCNPAESGPGVPERPSIAWEVGAPLSSGFRLPILWADQPEPFSRLIGRPTLTQGRTFEARYPALKESSWTFSARLGLPVLSRSQRGRASLSGKAGDSWKRSFGLPMWSSEPAPFSKRFRMHVLTQRGPLPPNHPAPFSERMGLPVLASRRTFLSRLFGQLASPHFALFGRNNLSATAAPFSSLIGRPVLWSEPTPLSSKLGRPVLSREPTPLSSKLTLPPIWANATPLSSLVRLPLLTRYQ